MLDILEALIKEILATEPQFANVTHKVMGGENTTWPSIVLKNNGRTLSTDKKRVAPPVFHRPEPVTFYVIYYVDTKGMPPTSIHRGGPGIYGNTADEFGFSRAQTRPDYFGMLENPNIEKQITEAIRKAIRWRRD